MGEKKTSFETSTITLTADAELTTAQIDRSKQLLTSAINQGQAGKKISLDEWIMYPFTAKPNNADAHGELIKVSGFFEKFPACANKEETEKFIEMNEANKPYLYKNGMQLYFDFNTLKAIGEHYHKTANTRINTGPLINNTRMNVTLAFTLKDAFLLAAAMHSSTK